MGKWHEQEGERIAKDRVRSLDLAFFLASSLAEMRAGNERRARYWADRGFTILPFFQTEERYQRAKALCWATLGAIDFYSIKRS